MNRKIPPFAFFPLYREVYPILIFLRRIDNLRGNIFYEKFPYWRIEE